MRTFFQIHTDRPPGDVLIFLPGQEDIESLEASIKLYVNQLPINHPAVSHFCLFLGDEGRINLFPGCRY